MKEKYIIVWIFIISYCVMKLVVLDNLNLYYDKYILYFYIVWMFKVLRN